MPITRNPGVIPIEESKRIDWNAIRSEYIGGDTSYRLLAEKYGISKDQIARKAKADHWEKDRATARDKAATKSIQRTAAAAANNAVLAADMKRRLLLRLQRIEEKFPLDATEVRTKVGNSTAIYRIRDLTGAYKDLVGDIMLPPDEGTIITGFDKLLAGVAPTRVLDEMQEES